MTNMAPEEKPSDIKGEESSSEGELKAVESPATSLVEKNNHVTETRPKWPEDREETKLWKLLGNEFDKWTYSYMNRLLKRGSRQRIDEDAMLTQDDIFDVPRSMRAQHLVSEFNHHFEGFSGHRRKLLKTLLRLAAPTFVPAGFCQLGTVVCQVSLPLLVRQLLRVMEDNPGENVSREGSPYAICIFLALFVNALCNHRHRHLATKTGIVLRSGVIGAIYERLLRLTPKGKRGLSPGEVSTLVAIDTQKVRTTTFVLLREVRCCS
jgi:hypothetical protein